MSSLRDITIKMVNIISSGTVFPAEPTPHRVLPLSFSDHYQPWTLQPVIFVYPKSSPSTFRTLKESLSSVLVTFYPFAGRLKMVEHDLYQIECNELGAQLLEAESEETLKDYHDFAPTTNKIKNLVTLPDYNRPVHERPLLLVQFTRFACGGYTLGVATSHVLADGYAALHFIESWAKTAKGEKIDVLPFLDRTVFSPGSYGPTSRINHEEIEKLPLILGASDDKEERKKETTPVMLKLTKEQVEQLKNKANKVEGPGKAKPPYSRFEAVTAHIWRSLCKARALQGSQDQPTKVRFPVDGRKRIKPPLPEGYFGNAVLPTFTSSCSFNEIMSQPLGYAAGKIREATERFTDEFIKSYLYNMASQPQRVSKMRGSFHIQGTTEGIFFGNPNVSVTSWINLPLHKANFGWGKPVYMGPVVLNADGKCIIVPAPQEDESLLVAIRLQTAHMDAFKASFYQDFAVEV